MRLKGRTELEASFKNGMRPSQTHFAELIESTLNMRDDQFLGRWKAGTTYRTGDIVVYERALWEMTDDGQGGVQEICSHEPPGPDVADWRSLVIPADDSDWFLVDIEADTPPTEGAEEQPLPATMHANPRVVRVGIGTDAPIAYLDVRDERRGRLLFDGCERPGPVLRLVRLDSEEAQHYLATWVERYAALVTDAPEGFAFRRGDPHEEFCAHSEGEAGPPLVAIKLDGRVGIGTEEPGARLEVTNEKGGRFLFNLDRKVNPALGIVNLRPGGRENYLATGVDNDFAAFVTDSDYGFVFRAGGESGTNDHEVDINQGKKLVWILPHGKGQLGIGRQPDDYQLDVDGIARAYGLYIDTDESHLTAVEPLGYVLDKLGELRPVTFEWDASTGLDAPGPKIGLIAHEVDDVFPEAVKTDGFGTKAVAYHALVPVLVKAVQEQQSAIDRMRSRLDDLQERIAALESPPEPDL
jgi:hypothetical protein